MSGSADLFPATYEDSRARFRSDLQTIRRHWPDARHGAHPLRGETGLTIDWIEGPATHSREHGLLFTIGEHGIEGYVGSAVLQLLIEEFLPTLDPATTSLFLVHAVNPWGMKHRRRTNASNVDLNRNFLSGPGSFDPSANPSYDGIAALLNPAGPIRGLRRSRLAFAAGLLAAVSRLGPARFREATLVGQYRYPAGLYYGGDRLQEETQALVTIFEAQLALHRRLTHLDVHTGYGPRRAMLVVTSALEQRSSSELAQAFSYPAVVKATSSEFYRIQGDMVDCIYALARERHPEKPFFAASFEYGTFGDGLGAVIRSLRAMVLENQLHHYGARSRQAADRIRREFDALFAPDDGLWRAQAVDSARRALRGILTAEGLLWPAPPDNTRTRPGA
jgi:predicted deacylase